MTVRKPGASAVVLSALFVGTPMSVVLSLAACSSTEGRWPSDMEGDSGTPGENAPDQPDEDGGRDAADGGEVAPPLPYDFAVTCTGAPCATRIAARGGAHACVVLQDGSVRCWGSNASGQLGTGRSDAGSMAAYAATPHRVLGITAAKDVAATGDGTAGTTCVIHGAGAVACFGSDAAGQLGRGGGASSNGANPEAAPVAGGLEARSVVLTNTFACAIGTDDHLWSWGRNELRQLARSTTGPGDVPANVPAHADTVTVSPRSCGGTSFAAFVVSTEGELLSWGGGPYDQLGRPTSLFQDPLPSVVPIADVSAVASGANHACALARGSVSCWGWNEHGELGTGRKAEELLPSRVLLPTGVYAVAMAAGGDNTCVIGADGDVYCWGANARGQLGTADGVDSPMPLRIDGLGEQAVSVAVMDEAVCALLRSGSVKCWGENFLGQLGRGSRTLERSPQPAPVVFE